MKIVEKFIRKTTFQIFGKSSLPMIHTDKEIAEIHTSAEYPDNVILMEHRSFSNMVDLEGIIIGKDIEYKNHRIVFIKKVGA